MKKEIRQICNDSHLLDWVENGQLQTTIYGILSSENANFTTEFHFGTHAILDFPEKGSWQLHCPEGNGDIMTIIQRGIKRYNKQKVTYLSCWLCELISSEIWGDFDRSGNN